MASPAGSFVLRPVTELRNPHTNKFRSAVLDRSISELSERSSADEFSPVVNRSLSVASATPSDQSILRSAMSDEDNVEDAEGSFNALNHTDDSLSGRMNLQQKFTDGEDSNGNSDRSRLGSDSDSSSGQIRDDEDENNNPKIGVVHDHEFLIRKRNVTLNIINENPYGQKVR